MPNVLLTGGTGFLGSALVDKLLAKGCRVISVSRHTPQLRENMVPLVGDITQPNLGLDTGFLFSITQGHIDSVYHLAGVLTLRQHDKDGSIWKTNVEGTRNVLDFCLRYDIPRLYFTSTAYTWPVNPYGISKIKNEEDIAVFAEKHGIETTIFKPSIVMGTVEHPYPGHFSRFVSALIRIHRRADIIRRKLEGTLRLPVMEPLFRIKGNPEGKLNLIQIDEVVRGIANIEETGTFWLTHPCPPTLQQLVDWIGEVIMVRVKFEPDFKPTPIEAVFQKVASPFSPYLQGDNFPSDLQATYKQGIYLAPPITKEFIYDTIKMTLLG